MKTATSNRQLKIETPVMVFLYRRLGRWMGGSNFLLLTTIGRKSGQPRTVMLVYRRIDCGYLVVAANVGLNVHPGWFLNLQHNPQAQIQIGRTKTAVVAQEVNPAEREKLLADWIQSNPGYKDFQAKTTRILPMVILNVIT